MAVSKSLSPREAFDPDPCQREAIDHVHGPMLVVAGAGTGKTTVLTKRIAQLIRGGHARPDHFLALTYTRNSAQEMRERARKELGGASLSGLQATTFHDYCNCLLKEAGRDFRVLEEADLWILLRRRIRELQLNYFIRAGNLGKFLRDLLDLMRRCQDELITPGKYAEYVGRLERGEIPLPRVSKSKDAAALSDEEILGRCREIAEVFDKVERMLREENLGTFGHMITGAYELLRQDKQRLAEAQQHASFILLDEFQDANFAQVKILQLLAGEEQNVFAVGDPDQSIYRFRGASSAAFELFRRHFPEARLVALEKNRRSTTPILRCGFAVINKNPALFPAHDFGYQRTQLVSARDEEAARGGGLMQAAPVEIVTWAALPTECSDVVSAIRERKRRCRCAWNQIAVLYRNHRHRLEVAAELAEQGIPFSIENMDVMDMTEVRDLLACLGAMVSADDRSLFRVAALPQFCLDPEQLRSGLRALPRDSAQGLAAVLERVEGGPALLGTLQKTREEIALANAKAEQALEKILRAFALPRTPAINAVLEFARAWEAKPLTETGTIGEFFEYLDYFGPAGGVIPLTIGEENGVRLMTVHAAKGLEWDHVFILRAQPFSFPASYQEPLVELPDELRDADSASPAEGKELHSQEERRLFYVAMTRARDTLTILGHQGRGKDPRPSAYVRDLLVDPGVGPWLRRRNALGPQLELSAGAAEEEELAGQEFPSRISEWLKLPPEPGLSAKLSASAMETYERCPLQFRFQREWRIPEEVPAAMQYGASVHRVLRTFYDALRARRTISDEELIEMFRADLASARLQERYQHELYEKQGVEQLRDFFAAGRQSPAEVLHTEEWFEVRVGATTTVVGRIDRIDRAGGNRVSITDYKTGRARTQEDANKSLQLSIYALAAREKWGYEIEGLSFYNLQENAAVMTRRNALQLEEARVKVQDAAKKIAAGNFQAKPGFHCSFCAYRGICPATERRISQAAEETRAKT